MLILYCAAFVAFLTFCLYPMSSLLGSLFTRLKRLINATAIPDTDTIPEENENVVTVKNNTTPRLYALTIGIDTYLNQPELAGAASDADKMVEFLTDDLGVPYTQIKSLRNSEATRANIIQAFQQLRDDTRIEKGFPILIYFAGHGGVETASDDWKAKYRGASKIQVIFPYDYEVELDGKKVNCIPDKTVAGLLNDLSRAKGDNITVIFDSCHSASGNRAPLKARGRQARNAKVRLPIPADIDENILVPVPGSTIGPSRHTNLPLCTHQTSHIHLAACSSEEQAWEDEGRGEFTTALLKTIRAHGVDKISYHNLIVGLPYLTKQTPHCYGAYKSRILFDECVPSQNVTFVPVIYDPNESTLTLQAGAASGVTQGSVWELREHAALSNDGIVGTTMVDSPANSSSVLKPETTEDDGFWKRCGAGSPYEGGKKKLYARLVKSGSGNELKVWFSPEAKRLIFPELENGTGEDSPRVAREFGYVAHPTRDSADMAVEIYQPAEHQLGAAPESPDGQSAEPEVVFHLSNSQASQYGISTLRRRKPARRDEVEMILFAAARWNWYLGYKNLQSQATVELEMFKIAEKALVNEKYSDEYWRQVPKSEWGNMNQTGVIDFEVHEKDLYAIKLNSGADRPLYVRMFYFDTTTFCIDDLFGHTAANGRADPDISARGDFTIGDDRDGGTPLPFGLDPGETVDVGYLKVFWSTDPLELDHVAQEPAFDVKKNTHGRKVEKTAIRSSPKSDWGTVNLTLVQRRPAIAST